MVLLARIFGETYQGIKAIEKIKYVSNWVAGDDFHSWNNMVSCKQQGKEVLEVCIVELENFGVPLRKSNNDTGINISLTQSQNQTININVLISALEEELTNSQLKEIKDLMNEDIPKSKKRTKIIDKIKSFGSDIASSIIANLLTNPSIWG